MIFERLAGLLLRETPKKNIEMELRYLAEELRDIVEPRKEATL
jgi:hypothetical protein